MSDTIFIRGLVVHARHGVMAHETEVGQRFIIDLELGVNLSGPSDTDRLSDTVSYADIVEVASAAFVDRHYKLVERAAGVVAEAVLARFPPVDVVTITIHKPHAPIAAIFDDVGVTLTKRRK